MLIDKLGGRKVLLTLIFLIVGVVLETTIGLSQPMLMFLLGLPSAFIIGNGVEHITGGQKSFKQALLQIQGHQKAIFDFNKQVVNGLNNMAVKFTQTSAAIDKLVVKPKKGRKK